MKKIAIIGAGPAGLAAAENLARQGLRVTIFERMPSPARKFLMAGRGGLNLTHSEDQELFANRYGRRRDDLAPALAAWTPADVVAWAEGLGQETFVGSSGRIFPKAMKASPLLRAWLKRLADLGVEIKLRHTWMGWNSAGQPLVSSDGLLSRPIECDAMILAVGGASWPRLGSDGSWRAALQDSGIPVAPFVPSNCGVIIEWSEHFKSRFSGEPLKRMAASFAGETQRGEAVVTRRGLEGGAIYALSSKIAARLVDGHQDTIALDLKPDEDLATITARLRRPRGKDSVSNWLRKCLKLPPVAIALLREVHRELPGDPDQLARLVKELPLPVAGIAGLDRAISTAGGVPFEAIDNNLMLKDHPGTFVAGEMLDWDAPTGGYLLQATLATGVLAANGAIAWLGA